MKSICFFGFYDSEYSRNKVLISGFDENGWQVIECQVDPRQIQGWKKYWRLFKEWQKLKPASELILVAYPGQTAVWMARLLFIGRRIIFDAFTSVYDSNVSDRKLYASWSLRGLRDFLLDWYSLRLAHLVLTDTYENAKYLQKTFFINAKKIVRVFVGTTMKANNIKAASTKANQNVFLVHFHGHFIPLQGVEHIIKAAKILEANQRIKFRIIGHGQEYKKIMELVNKLKPVNIEFLPEMPFLALADLMSQSDLVLGIFGTTPKAGRVIANKIFEGMAMGKAIVTSDTPAVRELLTNGENVILCQAGNAEDLAEKISFIEKNNSLSEKLGLKAKSLNESSLKLSWLVAELLDKIKNK